MRRSGKCMWAQPRRRAPRFFDSCCLQARPNARPLRRSLQSKSPIKEEDPPNCPLQPRRLAKCQSPSSLGSEVPCTGVHHSHRMHMHKAGILRWWRQQVQLLFWCAGGGSKYNSFCGQRSQCDGGVIFNNSFCRHEELKDMEYLPLHCLEALAGIGQFLAV